MRRKAIRLAALTALVAAAGMQVAQVNAQTRERCESDPRWFLTGRLEGRRGQTFWAVRRPCPEASLGDRAILEE